tara:strand:+ start:10343 stop:10672 length:330 start_codon:yes stop_codon:yes gene_type:complete
VRDFFTNCIRLVWHALYYGLTFKPGVEFALRCKEATEKIDLPDQVRTPREEFRLKLHLSLCQACHGYYKTTVILRAAVRQRWNKYTRSETEMENLNQKLLSSFSKPIVK